VRKNIVCNVALKSFDFKLTKFRYDGGRNETWARISFSWMKTMLMLRTKKQETARTRFDWAEPDSRHTTQPASRAERCWRPVRQEAQSHYRPRRSWRRRWTADSWRHLKKEEGVETVWERHLRAGDSYTPWLLAVWAYPAASESFSHCRRPSYSRQGSRPRWRMKGAGRCCSAGCHY